MKIGRLKVIAIEDMSGCTHGYVSDNIIFVSPAVYSLLHDRDVGLTVWQQIPLYNMNKIITKELMDIVDAQGFKEIKTK